MTAGNILRRCIIPVKRLLRFYIPLPCPVCGKPSFDGEANMLCGECLKQIQFLPPPYCPGCGGHHDGILEVCSSCSRTKKHHWDGAITAFAMEGSLKDFLHGCKYRSRPELGDMLGKLAFMTIRDRLPHIDCVQAVPLHWLRHCQRGYNQAELIAAPVAAGLGVPLIHALHRKKYTKQQAKLGKNERNKNLSTAFSVSDSTILKKRAILLIDDVMTTGATLDAATAELKKNGAGKVYVFALARRQ